MQLIEAALRSVQVKSQWSLCPHSTFSLHEISFRLHCYPNYYVLGRYYFSLFKQRIPRVRNKIMQLPRRYHFPSLISFFPLFPLSYTLFQGKNNTYAYPIGNWFFSILYEWDEKTLSDCCNYAFLFCVNVFDDVLLTFFPLPYGP